MSGKSGWTGLAVALWFLVTVAIPSLGWSAEIEEIVDIEGIVLDADTGKPLPEASVLLVGTQRGVFTDEAGRFRMLRVPVKGRVQLQVTLSGYASRIVHISLQDRGRTTEIRLQRELFEMEEMVVTATRIVTEARAVTDVVKVIGRAEIERSGASTMEQLLEQQPFFRIRKGNEGSLGSLRGFSGSYVLFLVDGKRMTSREVTTPNLDRYSLEDVERVEILKGAKSALYGSDAVGGVVNIITKLPKNPVELAFHSLYNPQNGHNADANLGFRRGPYLLHLGAGGGTHDGEGTHQDEQMYEFDHDKYHLKAKLRREGPRFRFGISTWYNTITRQPSYFNLSTDPLKKTFTDSDFSLSLDGDYWLSDRSQLSIEGQALSAKHTYERDDQLTHVSELSKSTGNDVTAGAHLHHQAWMGSFRHALTVGGGYQRESFDDPNVDPTRTLCNQVYRLSFADEMQKGRWIFSLAYSYEYSEGYGHGHTPQLGLKWDASDAMSLRLNLKKGYRAPTMSQRYRLRILSWHPYVIGREQVAKYRDDPLKPENAYGVEGEIRYRRKSFSLQINPFITYLRDKIATRIEENVELVDGRILSDRPGYIYTNYERQRSMGADVESSFQRQQVFGQSDRYRISLSYSFTRADTSGVALEEDPLHSVVLRLESGAALTSWLDMDVSLSGRAYDRRSEMGGSSGHASNIMGVQKKPYAITDLLVSFHLFDRAIKVYSGVNNLADFVDLNSRIVPGREVFAGIRWKYGS